MKNTFAQTDNSAAYLFSYGLKGGYTHSFITSQNQNMPQARPMAPVQNIMAPEPIGLVSGIVGVPGVFFGGWFRTSNWFFIQPEMGFVSKGAMFRFNYVNNIKEEASVYFVNFRMPVMLGVRFGTDYFDFDLMAGPSFEANIFTMSNFPTRISKTHPEFSSYRKGFLSLDLAFIYNWSAKYKIEFRSQIPMHYADLNFEQRLYNFELGVHYRFVKANPNAKPVSAW